MPRHDLRDIREETQALRSGFLPIDIALRGMDVSGMTAEELQDIASIKRAVARLEVVGQKQDERLERLETKLDRWDGALTLVKFAAGVFGFGGIAAIIWLISQVGRVA